MCAKCARACSSNEPASTTTLFLEWAPVQADGRRYCNAKLCNPHCMDTRRGAGAGKSFASEEAQARKTLRAKQGDGFTWGKGVMKAVLWAAVAERRRPARGMRRAKVGVGGGLEQVLNLRQAQREACRQPGQRGQ